MSRKNEAHALAPGKDGKQEPSGTKGQFQRRIFNWVIK
jgi:hypothetical protein